MTRLAVGFLLGAALPYIDARWGIGTALVAVGTIAPLLALIGLPNPGPIRNGRPIGLLLLIGFSTLAGFSLASWASYRPFHLSTIGVPTTILYDQDADYGYDVSLSGLAECAGGYVDVWGSRSYTIGGVKGWDAIGWQGSLRDLSAVERDPDIFGMVGMNNPEVGTSRRAFGVLCYGEAGVPWGYDNSPDGFHRSAAWLKVGGEWALAKPPNDEAQVVAMLQSSAQDGTTVLWRLENERLLSCVRHEPGAAMDRLMRLEGGQGLLSLAQNEEYIDSALHGGRLYILIAKSVGADGFQEFRIVKANGNCDSVEASLNLRGEGDGESVMRLDRPSIAIGPNEVVVLVDMDSLQIHEYLGGIHRRDSDSELDVGYDPTNSGIYQLANSHRSDKLYALAWAYRDDLIVEGKSTENVVVPLEWEPAKTRCLRFNKHLCLPEG